MTLANTARLDAQAQATGGSRQRAAQQTRAQGFTAALDSMRDSTRVAETARRAARPAAPDSGRTERPETFGAGPSRGADARGQARAEAQRPTSGTSAARAAQTRPAARDDTARAAQEGADTASARDASEARQAQTVAGSPAGSTQSPDEAAAARLAGLIRDGEAGAAEWDDEAVPEEADPSAEGHLPILALLQGLPVVAAAPAGGHAPATGLPGQVQGANSGTTAGTTAVSAAGTVPEGASEAGAVQARAAATVLAEARGGRMTGSNDPATGVGGDSAARTDAKSDLMAAFGSAAPAPPGLAPPPEMKAGHLQATVSQQAAPAQTAAPPVPIGQVPMTIGLRSLAGSSQFEIRLDPAELGRIDVTLDIDKERGTVTTHLVVERIDTLAMLQRDAGSLQQALSQAGLDASADGGIRLSLRGDGGTQDQGQGRGEAGGQEGRGRRGGWAGEASEVAEAAPLRSLRGIGSLDIRI